MKEIIVGRLKGRNKNHRRTPLSSAKITFENLEDKTIFYMKTQTIPGPLAEITDVINKTVFKTKKNNKVSGQFISMQLNSTWKGKIRLSKLLKLDL